MGLKPIPTEKLPRREILETERFEHRGKIGVRLYLSCGHYVDRSPSVEPKRFARCLTCKYVPKSIRKKWGL